ncbi:hypothetical protein MSAN_01726400 [Mycena sanguinolenta]|uniref:F-box domain-containing protein n=1 Tax=Mycena sanguinolenta TaxID=230812 RepID=A0A8H6XZE5_9AGAR|nr:hypothetical protein MSAN_01726400 [Mycena sanguinolenta]
MNNDPVFPPELFAVIIGALADDLKTLRSCALVSSTFYGLARVFSHLQVGPRLDGEHDFPQFCALLEGSPPFAARVESLRICVKWDPGEPNPRKWILEADLGRCFSLLVSLTRLCITVDSGSLSWLTLSHANRNSIQAILPILTCLELKNVILLPPALLSHCSLLRSLTLDDVIFDDSSGAAADTDNCNSSIHLRYLVLRLRAIVLIQFVDWVTNPESLFDFSCLHSLEYTTNHPSNQFPIQRLLNASSPSLQRLRIQKILLLSTVADEVKLDLRQLAHLRTLALDIYLNDWEAYNHERLLSLRNFVFPPPQQQLALVLDVFTEEEPRRTDIMQRLADVDHVVARLPFETVTVIVWAWSPENGRKDKLIDVCDQFVPAMPLLASKPGRTDRLRILESITGTHA